MECLKEHRLTDFRGYPNVEYTEEKSADFRRNNCGGGQTGSWVTYTKSYTSYVSEQDLQSQITSDAANFNAEGQAYANANGTCSVTCTPQTTTTDFKGLAAIGPNDVWLKHVRWPHYSNPVPVHLLQSSILAASVSKSLFFLSSTPISDTLERAHNSSPTQTAWPHTNGDIQYKLVETPTGYSVQETTSSNKCSTPVQVGTVGATKQRHTFGWHVVRPGSGMLTNGVFIVSSYNPGWGFAVAQVHFIPYGGTGYLVGEVRAPYHYAMSAHRAGGIIYTEATGYATAAFCSTTNGNTFLAISTVRDGNKISISNRRKVAVFQINKDFSGSPTGLTQISDWSYSSERARILEGTNIGPHMVFLYREIGHMGVISDASIPNPPSSVFSIMGDNTEYGVMYGMNDIGTVKYKYTLATNTWTQTTL